MVKNIIFDFGGVILTLDPEKALKRFIELGITDAREQMNIYGQTGIFLELENGSISADEFRHRLAKEAQEKAGFFAGEDNPSYSHERALWAWQGYIGDVPQKNLDCLLRLREKDFNVCLLSNTNPFLMGWAATNEFSRDGHPIQHYFDHLYYSYQMNDYKPALSIFRKMLDQGKMKADECLFLDDSPRNIAAAEQVGIRGMLIGKGEDWVERLEKEITNL